MSNADKTNWSSVHLFQITETEKACEILSHLLSETGQFWIIIRVNHSLCRDLDTAHTHTHTHTHTHKTDFLAHQKNLTTKLCNNVGCIFFHLLIKLRHYMNQMLNHAREWNCSESSMTMSESETENHVRCFLLHTTTVSHLSFFHTIQCATGANWSAKQCQQIL